MRRLQALLQRAFFVDSEARKRAAASSSSSSTIRRASARIFDALGYDRKSHITYHLNRNVLEEDCCIAAFLRGAFLMAGTVAGPDKKSHLELKSTHQSLTGEETSLMLDLGLAPKQARRASAQLLYFKDSASVEDFLTRIGAPHAAMELMQAKVEKNLSEHHQPSGQLRDGESRQGGGRVRAADRRDQTACCARAGRRPFRIISERPCVLRLSYPTDSLTELARRFDPPISKPGLSHRLKKITEFAAKEN